MQNRIIGLLFALTAISSQARLVTYPAGSGVATIDDYSVAVRQLPAEEWLPVSVYPVKVDEVTGTGHEVRVASMAYFDFDGEVEVRITPKFTKAQKAVVRPLSYEIEAELTGDTLTFSLDRPRNLSVEFNGDIFRNLHLFANPIDSHRPTAKEIKKNKDLIYFGPGYHKLAGGKMKVPASTTVYVDGGARVDGTLIVDGVENVRFFGRGEIHPEEPGFGIDIRNSKNIEADGVIVTQIPVGGSDGVKINNVKAISSYGWGDGMNVFASNNVAYDRVFCRNSDDCSTIYATRKGFRGGCENIKMRNSTLWADVAHPIMIGIHGSAKEIGEWATPDTICNVLYENIDILDHAEKQLDYQGCLAINCGDNNVVRNLVFDNIRVEDFREGQLFNIRIFYNKKYCAAPGTTIENILFKDITYNGDKANISIISGYDEQRKIKNIIFENLVINGTKISDTMEGKPRWFKTGDMARIFVGEHVENVIFK